jgi:ClpP class serine protease
VVLHQPAARGQGPIPDLILQADEVVRMRADIEAILSKHTGRSVQTLRADTDRDRVFTARAALEYGLADEILGQRAADDGASAAARSALRVSRRWLRVSRPWLRGEREHDRAGGLLAAQVGGHLLGQADERDAQGSGEGRDHLARRFLAPALDLGQVLRRDSGPTRRLRERLLLLQAERPQASAEDLAPEWLLEP